MTLNAKLEVMSAIPTSVASFFLSNGDLNFLMKKAEFLRWKRDKVKNVYNDIWLTKKNAFSILCFSATHRHYFQVLEELVPFPLDGSSSVK